MIRALQSRCSAAAAAAALAAIASAVLVVYALQPSRRILAARPGHVFSGPSTARVFVNTESPEAKLQLARWANYTSGTSPVFCKDTCCWQWRPAEIPYQGNTLQLPSAADLINSNDFGLLADAVMFVPYWPLANQLPQWPDQEALAVLDNSTAPCLQNSTIIFMEGHWFWHFAKYVLPDIKASFVLVSHGGDVTLPGEEFKHVLDDERVLHWFTLNCGPMDHPKLSCLPLGVSMWKFAPTNRPYYLFLADALRQGMGLSRGIATAASQPPAATKSSDKNMLVNFNLGNHASRAPLWRATCNSSDAPLRHLSTCLSLNYGRSMVDFFREMAAHRFVLSPRGAGQDAYRTWETLLMGSYPIVPSREHIASLYAGLPVLALDDLEHDITPALLDAVYKAFSQQPSGWQYHKLFMGHWYNVIYQHRHGVNKRHRIVYWRRS